MTARLQHVVDGRADTLPPILSALWQALDLGLRAAPPGRWIDGEMLADVAAQLVDASPALADELIAAAVESGRVQRHRARPDLIRRTRPPAPGRNRDRTRNTNRRR